MIRFCNLFSGSSGNSTYIETQSTKILIDAGVSCSRIERALNTLEVSLDEIDAILITHEHSDHIKGLPVISRKYKTPIFATNKTWAQMNLIDIQEECKKSFTPGIDFKLRDATIHPFSIPHDAADPCGFSILSHGKKVTVATDIGHIENELVTEMTGSDALLIEANYDNDTLLCGAYPYFLKKRIASDIGHLSNENTSKLVRTLYESGVTNFILGHLSKENNFPELAYQTVLNELNTSELKVPFNLTVAKRDTVDEVLELI